MDSNPRLCRKSNSSPLRRARAEALANFVGNFGGEIELEPETYRHLRLLGLSRRDVDDAAETLVAEETFDFATQGPTVVLRRKGGAA